VARWSIHKDRRSIINMMNRLASLSLHVGFACALIVTPAIAKEKKKADASADGAAKEKKGGKTAPASPVDLNSASQAQLESVPGIGAPTAKKIIAGRPYSATSDLARAGVPAATISKIESMVMVGPPTAPPLKTKTPPLTKAPSASAPAAMPSTSTSNASNTASNRAPTSAAVNTVAKPGPTPAVPPPAPGMVWVNLETKVYHKQGDRWYGNTKKGKYMTEADALKAGYRASKE
jgi:hypothetical protein